MNDNESTQSSLLETITGATGTDSAETPSGTTPNPVDIATEALRASIPQDSPGIDAEIKPRRRKRTQQVLEEMGVLPGQISSGQAGNQTSIPETQAPFANVDLALWQKLVDGCVDALDEFGQNLIEGVVRNLGQENDICKRYRCNAAMGESTKALIKTGAFGCVKKYALTWQYVDETALLLGLGFYGIGLKSQLSAIKRELAPQTASATDNRQKGDRQDSTLAR